jgi:hypothetical protein
MNWTTFGWAGITLQIPADWELSGLSGDEKEGYLRLDDAEIPRMELKWARSKRKKPDLNNVLDEYFKLVRKNYKRKSTKLHIQRDINLIKNEEFFEGRDVIAFSWKGEIRATGVIFHCETCRRITIVQVMGHLKENFRTTTVRILESVHDHPTEQHILWSAYNLNVKIPRRYRLEKQKLLSGYLLFTFADGSRKVSVERYGPADITLKEHDIESWFRSKYAKAIRGYGFDITANTANGDEALTLVGEQLRLTDRIPFTPVLAVDKVLRRKTFAACLWRCHKSNRIYVVQAIAKRDAVKTAEDVAGSIRCHEKI